MALCAALALSRCWAQTMASHRRTHTSSRHCHPRLVRSAADRSRPSNILDVAPSAPTPLSCVFAGDDAYKR
eukprot:1549123-Prymnesium_polylepis.1